MRSNLIAVFFLQKPHFQKPNQPMKPKIHHRRLVLATFILIAGSQAHADNFYWDSNGATAGTGGGGNWTTTGSLWRAAAVDGALGSWVNGNAAFLGDIYGTLTTTAAIQANQINVVAGTIGTAPYTISNGTGGSLTFSGLNKQVNVASGTSLLINPRTLQVSGAGETSMLTVQGGGTLTMTGINRCYGGNMTATGTGTRLIFTGGNALNLGTAGGGMPAGSVGLVASSGGTIQMAALSNYTAAIQLSAGTLEVSTNAANGLVLQGGGAITVLGTAKSSVIGTAGVGNTAVITANAATRIFTVGATGDASGYDLEISASSGLLALVGNANNLGNFQKNGTGVMRLLPGAYFSANRDLSFDFSKNSLIVNAGTFQNENQVYSTTTVNNGGTARTGISAGAYDAVTVNTGGTFELSRPSGSFTPGLPFASGQNSLSLNGGRLRYVAVSTDISSSISALTTNGVIDTNSQSVTFSTGLTGGGSLEKSGSGTLTLNAANTYTGTTSVTSGTLAIGAAGSVASTIVSVGNGANLDVTSLAGAPLIDTPGDYLTGTGTAGVTGTLHLPAGTLIRPGGLNLEGTTLITGDLTLAGTYEADLTPSANDLIIVSGTANLTGADISPVSLAPIASQTYTLLNYGTLVGNPVLSPAFIASRYAPTLNLGPKTSPGSITLTIAGSLQNLTWSGAASSTWINAGPLNWKAGATDEVFRQLDSVTFNDTPATDFVISIPDEVIPTGMSFLNNSRSYSFTGAGFISGTGGLNKTGAGTVILGTNNTFTGPILNDLGILQIGNGGTSGAVAGGNLTNNGQLVFNRSNDFTAANLISGSGTLEKLGSGKLTLTGANTYTGTTAINGGTLSISADGQLGTAPVGQTLTLNGALEVTAGITLNANRTLILGPLDAVGNGTINTNTAEDTIITYNGTLINHGTGTGGLVKTGAGALALGSANLYSGPTQIQSGSVRISNVSSFGTAVAGTSVESGAWIYFLSTAQAAPIEEPFTIAGNGAGSGALRAGTGSARYTLAAPLTLSASANIYVDANSAMDFTNIISGNNTDLSFQNGTATCTFDGAMNLGTGGFTKTGAGITILNGNNTYGGTTISAATLQIGTGSSTGTLGSGNVLNNGTLILNRGDDVILANNITGTGAFNKSGGGSALVSGTHSYTGTTTVSAGTLLFQGIHTGGSAYGVAAGTILAGNGVTTSQINLTGSISPGNSGATPIDTLSTGTLELRNNSSLAIDINTTTLTADRIAVTGDVTRPGTTVNLVLTDRGSDVALADGTKFILAQYSGTWLPANSLTFGGNPVPNNTTITLGANIFTVRYDDEKRLTLTVGQPTTGYDAWIIGFSTQIPNPADRAPGVDFDKDGLINFAEFALNGDPADPSNNGLFAVVTQDTDTPPDTQELTLVAAVLRNTTFTALGTTQQGSNSGVTYTVEGSLALGTWDSPVSTIAAAANTAPAASGLADDLTGTAWEYRTFSLDASEALAGKGFLRIKLSN